MKPRLPALIASSLTALLTLAACGGGGDDGEVQTLEIEANKASCYGMAAYPCFLVRSPGTADWTRLFEAIGGFDYAWGRRYVLQVRVKNLANPGIADGPARSVTLVAVQSVTPVPATTTYSVLSRPQLEWRRVGDGWQWLGLPLACAPEACARLAELEGSSAQVEMVFDHRNSPAGPLYLLSVGAPLSPG